MKKRKRKGIKIEIKLRPNNLFVRSSIIILRKNESGSTGFDWLTDHQENFEKNQKNLDLKVSHNVHTKRSSFF
jgi:hypothetical protein